MLIASWVCFQDAFLRCLLCVRPSGHRWHQCGRKVVLVIHAQVHRAQKSFLPLRVRWLKEMPTPAVTSVLRLGERDRCGRVVYGGTPGASKTVAKNLGA